ncbi:MAG: mobile mystery protein A [Acidimicrobiales bacterium]|nr:mobile mystery protein A [Acidimicrobiales bacterium]
MEIYQRATQARRELDRKFAATALEPIRTRPRSGWIRSVRGALNMSQVALAERLGISAAAVNKLERAEVNGGITIGKLSQVSAALDCTLVYALIPNSTLEQTVLTRAKNKAADILGYAAQTMVLEDQRIEDNRLQEAIDQYADQLVAKGNVWKTTRPRSRGES